MPELDPPPCAREAVAAIRGELGTLRASIDRIERRLGNLEAAPGRPSAAPPRSERYLRVLVEVYERGGQPGVDSETLALIGRSHGYDRRGLGGFFTGARAPLERLGDRVRLTPSGEALMAAYLEGAAE
ncbi:MAG TPA: hypothetical protein VKV21_05315 [Solirubrobacteraceae bacterium]|nr:hypothetical protein [Solirubrobacteraceae bacterium]